MAQFYFLVGNHPSLQTYGCNCKRDPLMSVNLGKSCFIVLSVSAACAEANTDSSSGSVKLYFWECFWVYESGSHA